MKYAWIREHRSMFPVSLMCGTLGVSTSGYYSRLQRKPGPRAQRGQRIRQTVRRIYDEHHGIYGSYKIADVMRRRDDLDSACRNTVAAAMRELGLKSRVCKAFKPVTTTTDPTKRPAANLLEQRFQADQRDRKWVTDITYLATRRGWVYLAVVMDLFSRKVVGWSIDASLATDLVAGALRNAIESRKPASGLLHHSDRGCQYTSDGYQKTLKTLGIVCSMSRTGNCYDNAAMERFFWSLKHEWTNHEAYENLAAARLGVFRYIEMFYNPRRIHQALGYQTPEQFEAQHPPTPEIQPTPEAPNATASHRSDVA